MNLALAQICLGDDDAAESLPAAVISRLLAESIDTVLILDQYGVIRFVNAAVGKLSGYAPAELLGAGLDGLLSEAVAAAIAAEIARYEASLDACELLGHVQEMSLRHRTGELVPIELKAIDLGVVRGTRYFGAFLADLRPRKRLEAENAALLAELSRQAATDPLTGLLNRRAFEAEAERLLARADRQPTDIAVAALDLDRFKRVNDTYGHPAGDMVLRAVVAGVQKQLRRSDLFGRIGGEEFALLLPDTTEASATVLAERLRLAVANTEMLVPGAEPFQVTISIGLTARHPGDALGTLLARADHALYDAKAAGRNRVAIA